MGKAVILEKTVSLSAFSIDQTEIQNITFPEFYKNLLILKRLNSIDKCKISFTKIFIQRLLWRFKPEGFSGSIV